MLLGSSPRVWGQVRRGKRHVVFVRIIPTRMGTSPSELDYYFRHGDHPHAYGDKVILSR